MSNEAQQRKNQDSWAKARAEQLEAARHRVRASFNGLSEATGRRVRQAATHERFSEEHREAQKNADREFDRLINEKQQHLSQAEKKLQCLNSEIEASTLQIKTRKAHLTTGKKRLSAFHALLSNDKGLYMPTQIPAQELQLYLECTDSTITAAIDSIYDNQRQGHAYFGFNRHNLRQHWLYYTTFLQPTEAEEALFDLLSFLNEKLEWIDKESAAFDSDTAFNQGASDERRTPTSFLPARNLWTMKEEEQRLLRTREEISKTHKTILEEKQALQQQKAQALEPSRQCMETAEKQLRKSQYTEQLFHCQHAQAQLALTILTLELGLLDVTKKTGEQLTQFQRLKENDTNEAFQCFLNFTESDVTAAIHAVTLMTTRQSFHESSLSELATAIEQGQERQASNLKDLAHYHDVAPAQQLITLQGELLEEFSLLQEKAAHLIALKKEKAQQLKAMSDFMRLMKQRQTLERVLNDLASKEQLDAPTRPVSELKQQQRETTKLLHEMEKHDDPAIVCQAKQVRQASASLQSYLERYQTSADLAQLTNQQQRIEQTLRTVVNEHVSKSNPGERISELIALGKETAAVLDATKNQANEVMVKQGELNTLLAQLKPHLTRYEEENDKRQAEALLDDCDALIARFNRHNNRPGLYEAYEDFFTNPAIQPLLTRLKLKKGAPFVDALLSKVSAMEMQRAIMAPETGTARRLFGETPPSPVLPIIPPDPVKKQGVDVSRYLQQLDHYLLARSRTYYVRDKFSQWAGTLFSYSGYRSEKDKRSRYVFDLKAKFDTYQKESSLTNYQALIAFLEQGIEAFSPRAAEGAAYELSLRAHLVTIKRQVPAPATPDPGGDEGHRLDPKG